MRYLTAGESHGKALTAILEGCPANLSINEEEINKELSRRQEGYGRGGRMQIEKDTAEILSGIRKGKTIGSPIAILIPNKSTEFFGVDVTKLRPGHADLAGAIKYNQKDIRNILERASARSTASQVAIGAIAKKLLSEFNINVAGKVHCIGGKESKSEWEKAIDKAREDGDTLGGVFEITVTGLPVGLGSYASQDRRLSGILAHALLGIPAIKGVEFGLGFGATVLPGSKVHDEVFYEKGKGFFHKTNNAGGLEGGITNGEPLIIRAAMKPISTLKKPLKSVDLASKKAVEAFVERSDICAVEAAAVIGEAVVAYELANAFLDKFGGDSLEEIKDNFSSYQKRLAMI
ncbi:MAG: chorismate synthase [Candidatus Margulisiibacteriota bacterium]